MVSVQNRTDLVKLLPRNALIAEIGVARGLFSKSILSYSHPKQLNLIDAWLFTDSAFDPDKKHPARDSQEKQNENYQFVLKTFYPQIQSGQVTVQKGLSVDMLNKYPNGYFDWVYIDANHRYEFVKQDLELCRLKVKKKGLICGHDYIGGNFVLGVKYGVIQAVDEFCLMYGWKIVCMADEICEDGNYKSYVLASRDKSYLYEIYFGIKAIKIKVMSVLSRIKKLLFTKRIYNAK